MSVLTRNTRLARWWSALAALLLLPPAPPVRAQGAPIPATLPVPRDTSALDLRVLGTSMSTRRTLVGPDGVSSGSGPLRGAEGWVRGSDVGLFVRYVAGDLGERAHQMLDARLMIGDARTAIEVGWLLRTRPGEADSTVGVPRLGLRLLYPIGGSGATVYFGGGGYFAIRNEDSTSVRDNGWDAESGIRYSLARWRLPFEVQLGYRLEVFRSRGRDDELGSVILGAGVNLVGR